MLVANVGNTSSNSTVSILKASSNGTFAEPTNIPVDNQRGGLVITDVSLARIE